jgi:hypothetical protein
VQRAEPRNARADYDDICLVAHAKIFTPTAGVCKEKLAGRVSPLPHQRAARSPGNRSVCRPSMPF